VVLAVALGVSASGACAMSASASDELRCRVIGGDKLPAESGGAGALCATIRNALAKQAPNVRVSVEVRVLRPSMLATILVVEGRTLPEQKFAVMDRNLNTRSIERFAQSIATKVAEAAAL
jgi:hypothetical protein